MAQIPQLAELHKKYSEQGLHIVALERQNATAQDITALLSGKGAGYQATMGGTLANDTAAGFPRGYLFGTDGKLAGTNLHGRELEDKIKELLQQTYAAYTGPGPYEKLASVEAQVRTGKGIGAALNQLRSSVKSTDAATAKEAAAMLENLEGGVKALTEKALAKKTSDPLAALKELDRLARDLYGDETGARAKKEADALRRDPAVIKEIEADGIWTRIEEMNEKLKPIRGKKDPRDPAFRKANMAAIQQMVGGCQMIEQRYAGTKAAEKAKAFMDQYR